MILDKNLDTRLSNSHLLSPYRLNCELSVRDMRYMEANVNRVPFEIIMDMILNPDKIKAHDRLIKTIFCISEGHQMFSHSVSWGVPEMPDRIIHITYGSIQLALRDNIWGHLMEKVTPYDYDKFLRSDNKGNGYTYFNIDLMNHIS